MIFKPLLLASVCVVSAQTKDLDVALADKPLSNVYKHLRQNPELIINTYLNPQSADIATKGSRKGKKGVAKMKEIMSKYKLKFASLFEKYEDLFRKCGTEIGDIRLLDNNRFILGTEGVLRGPTENFRTATVRFRKTFIYISSRELTWEKCGNTGAMGKYKKIKAKLDRHTHNLGFHLCSKQNQDDFICTEARWGYDKKITIDMQTSGDRFIGVINQDEAGENVVIN